jgi:flavodoxin
MNIGILVHSQTGHTLSVAQRIETRLKEQGHTCRIERISARDEEAISRGQVMQPIQLINPPDPLPYDALILGAPVWGFSLSKVMSAYLDRIPKLSGKKTACFITHTFPHPLLGGNRSLKQLKSACQQKEASIYASGIIDWSNSRREDQIESLVKSLSQIA